MGIVRLFPCFRCVPWLCFLKRRTAEYPEITEKRGLPAMLNHYGIFWRPVRGLWDNTQAVPIR
jgi:hypothetical protein